jgi:hypothetical protein
MTFHNTISHALASRLVVRCRILLALLLTTIAAIVLCAASTAPAEAQQQQLQLLQPNGSERLQSGSEYTIRWTGTNIDPALPVRLEYSTDGGASWKLITAAASGGAYLWKPVPNDPSITCFVKVSSLANDSSISVSNSLVTFTPDRSGVIGIPVEQFSFSPDGSKIFVTFISDFISRSDDVYTLRTYKTCNMEMRDAKTGRTLYKLPNYTSGIVSGKRFWQTAKFSDVLSSMMSQSCWSPDNTLLLAPINDSTFGVFDTQTGNVQKTITVPRMGESILISTFQWAAAGREILATVHYGRLGPNANGYQDTIITMMMRFEVLTGLLSNTPFSIRKATVSGWEYCTSNFFGSSSHDGDRRISVLYDSVLCIPKPFTVHSTRDNSVLWSLPNNGQWIAGQWGSHIWSPNDSLLLVCETRLRDPAGTKIAIVNAFTGNLVRRISLPVVSTLRFGEWSPDSRKILLEVLTDYKQPSTVPRRVVIDAYQGTLQANIPKMQEAKGMLIGGEHGLYDWSNSNDATTGNSTMTWSPNSRFLAGFLWQDRSKKYINDNITNTVGIWDAGTGCLVQRFNLLAFPDDSGVVPKRSFFNKPIQWSGSTPPKGREINKSVF